MYFVKICHPNEISKNLWKTVDSFSSIDDIEEHIASPAFDPAPATCVRVMYDNGYVLYNGICGHGHCVDVDQLKVIDPVTQKGLSENLFDAWTQGNSYVDGILILGASLPPKLVIDLLRRHCESVYRYVNAVTGVTYNLLVEANNVLLNRKNIKKVRSMYDRLIDNVPPGNTLEQQRGYASLASAFSSVCGAHIYTTPYVDKETYTYDIRACAGSLVSCYDYSSLGTLQECSAELMWQLRNQVDFYEIATGIIS